MLLSLPAGARQLAVVATAALVGLALAAPAQTPPTPADGPHPAAPRPTSAGGLRRAAPATRAAIAAQPTRPASRVSGPLQQLYRQATSPVGRGAAPTDGARALRAEFPRLKFNKETSSVLVRITAQDVDALLPALRSRGFEVVTSYPQLRFVEGLLPLSALAPGAAGLEGLASRGLLGVLPAWQPLVRGGLVTSQADYALEAARARATRPRLVDGRGVRIGVMSDSFNSLAGAANDVRSGDLPAAGVQVLQDLTDEQRGTDEGRAMCQLINDLAPGAPLAFSSVYLGEGNFAQQVIDLADPAKGNCRVLVDDIAYFGEPLYQDGVIAQAINQVVSRGAAYFSSAGNEADHSYENNAPQFVQGTIGPATAARLNFDPSGATTDVAQRIVLADGAEFFPALQWSDPFYTTSGVKTDLDLYLIAVKNGVAADTVARATDDNRATLTPLEILDYVNDAATSGTTNFDFVVVRRAGSADPARLKYIDNGSYGATEWKTGSSTIVGHAAAAGAQAVAAVPYFNQRRPEYFTSKGGTLTYLFGPTGTPLATPELRQKPDITAIDGTNTSFFGADQPGADLEGDGFPNFFGTSAAAPHAAAVAALLRAAEPALTPAQVYARLAGSARLIGTTATDPLTGPGLMDAFTALYGPVVAQAPPVIEDLEKGALPPSWSVSSTTAGRVQVLSDLGPASGRYELLLDAPYAGSTSARSLNEVEWRLGGAGGGSLQLSFRERKLPGETDELMPAQFTDHSNSDGVALSVDGGATWYRVFDLTGPNATTTYQTKVVDLSQFAATNGLTIGGDLRLRFQQYGGAVTTTAPATQRGRLFDDIALTRQVGAPVPLYTALPAGGCPGLTVAFTDTSALHPTAWAWSFPGGTPAASTQRNPTVVYNAPGHYPVSLSVRNAAGLAARTDTGVVFVYGRAPQATVAASRTSLCPGGTVTFSSPTASFCPATYAWSFPGGTPAAATDPNPGPVTYPAVGSYLATLTVSNAYGSTSYQLPVLVTSGQALPFAENFDASLALPPGWTLTNPDGQYAWRIRGGTYNRQGVLSNVLRAPFAVDANVGEQDAIATPALTLTGVAQPTLLFDLAYAPFVDSKGAVTADSLLVQVVDACTGNVLGQPYQRGSRTLPTAAASSYLFVPASGADWRQERVDLTAFAGQRVLLRFVGVNNFGNSLYLDNVQIGSNLLALTAAASAVGLEAWPNPTPTGAELHVRLPAYRGPVGLRLIDNLGRTVWQEQVLQTGAALERTLRPGLAPGLYNLLYAPASGPPAARRLVLE